VTAAGSELLDGHAAIIASQRGRHIGQRLRQPGIVDAAFGDLALNEELDRRKRLVSCRSSARFADC
jgi:hypothetical protein